MSEQQNRYYDIQSIVGIVTILSIVVALITPILTVNISIFSNWLFQVGVIALIAVLFGTVLFRANSTVNAFTHLTFHYTGNKNDQGYVEFRHIKRAFPISQHLESCVKQHKILKVIHPTESDIFKSFQKNKISLVEGSLSLKDIGLMERPDGSICRSEPEIQESQLKKLLELRDEGKLDNFRIWFIYPKLWWFFPSFRHFPTTKRIIVNYNVIPYEAYPAPVESLQLVGGILQSWQEYPWSPMDRIGNICRKKKIVYKGDEKHCTIRKLIEEAQKLPIAG